jgi:ComEC/Rec2-related protein
VAGALILLISPVSVSSVGFWLSFLATFGLVTYLRVFNLRYERLISRGSERNAFVKCIVSFGVKIAGVISVSLCANVFICVVFWIIFGEMSVIFPVANLFIAPLAQAYLLLSLAVFAFGWIPYFGTFLSLCAKYM